MSSPLFISLRAIYSVRGVIEYVFCDLSFGYKQHDCEWGITCVMFSTLLPVTTYDFERENNRGCEQLSTQMVLRNRSLFMVPKKWTFRKDRLHLGFRFV